MSSFGAGGISPGLWRTLGGNDCSWVRRSSSGAVLSSIRSFGGPRCEQVDASDATFAHQGCVPFWSEPGPSRSPWSADDPMRGPSDVVGFTSQGCGRWDPLEVVR